ncbi:MAG: nucleoside-diphosphate kinase [Armatimonadetes bacterium]|nr:nucleoside-diphosphate kinase [Armatimonadota bacterium]
METTLLIIKPDAVQRGLMGRILCRIEEKGLKILGLRMQLLSRQRAEHLYEPHKNKAFFERLVHFITSGPLVSVVVGGEDAIRQIRHMMGATDCREAAPGTIRGDYGLSIQNNLVHGSDSWESAQREIPIFFTEDEVLSYEKPEESWVYAGE